MTQTTIEELQNLGARRPDDLPPGYGYSILVRPPGPPEVFVAEWVSVWRPIAAWGRWFDEALGDWPDEEEFLASLPPSFSAALLAGWRENVGDWIRSLHDRDWVLWSIAACGKLVKIDLDCSSMPISSFGPRLVAEVLGGEVIDYGDWIVCS
jgi:hypothetical protein